MIPTTNMTIEYEDKQHDRVTFEGVTKGIIRIFTSSGGTISVVSARGDGQQPSMITYTSEEFSDLNKVLKPLGVKIVPIVKKRS